MILVRGSIYLANLNPRRDSEIGKIRPVLVTQSDRLNSLGYETIIILPLTSILRNDEFLRFHITKRDKLSKDSDVLCTQFRALDASKFTSGVIATLNEEEMQQVEEKLSWILGFND